MRTGWALLGALAWMVFALGCESLGGPYHEHEIAHGWQGAPQVRRVLLVPMNATTSIAEELEPGADATFALVRERLEGHGIAIREVDSLYHYRDAWRESFQGVKLHPNKRGDDIPSEAIAHLFAALRRKGDFDALVIPDLEIRPVRLNGGSGRWDGVTRDLVDERYGALRKTGYTNAVSLRIRVYTEQGERVFDSLGGLDMIFKIAGGDRMTLVDAPLSDEGHLRQGVRIALDPLVPLDE